MKEGSVDNDEVQKDERPLYFAKIVVVGDCGVGKTSLMRAFFDADFSQSYMATVGVDFRIATIPLDDIDVKVHVWDTAGQERYRSLTAAYFRGAMGIAICYDASLASCGSGEECGDQLFATRKSKVFRGVEKWKELVDHSVDKSRGIARRHKAGHVLCVRRARRGCNRRVVFQELGVPHVLTSSRDNINVKEPFLHIIRSLREGTLEAIQQERRASSGGGSSRPRDIRHVQPPPLAVAQRPNTTARGTGCKTARP